MILITGATSGIGLACAEVFAEAHHELFLLGRRVERLKRTQDEYKSRYGVAVHYAELDVRDRKAVERFASDNARLLEKTTVLINNAGLAKGREPIQEGNPENWDVMWDTNVKGLLNVTHVVLPYFLKANRGHIVNMSSVASRWAYPSGNIYSATKRAVSALSESMRLDLLGKNIRVTEIAPGMAETEFSEVRFGDAEKAKAVYRNMIPLEARDIAEAVYWAVNRPARVNIQEIVLYPTDQASPTAIYRREK